jgi:hypothetical protein
MERPDLMKTPQPAHHPRRSVLLELPALQHERLVRMAKERGQPVATFALNLFNAAYSARQAPTGDTALDEAVRGIESAVTSAPAAAADVSREVERLQQLLAGAVQDREDAEAAMRQAQHERDMRDKRIAEMTDAMKGAAVISDHAGALIRERDDRIALLEEAQAEKCAANALMQERAHVLTEQVLDRDNEIAALKEQLSARVRELLVARSDLATSAEETSRWQAMADSLGTQLEAALRTRNEAERRATDALPMPGLTPAQVRMARGLRAAGNSIDEIATELGTTAALVRQALEGN